MTTAAVQTIWADVLAGALADAGVRTVVVSPGSRSTPITAALARATDLELVTIIDERAAAFYALGAARATDQPVALACTSGTAAAHYLPALIEASLADVPLVALTTDRPPELQACGASQTIEQHGLYRAFVRGEYDPGAPAAADGALRALRRTITQAVVRARGPHPGPVHVNVPLRKPLEPAAPSTPEEHALARLAAALRTPRTDALVRLAAALRTPRTDTPQTGAPRIDAPHTGAPRMDTPSPGAFHSDALRIDAPHTDAPRIDASHTGASRIDAARTGAPHTGAPGIDAPHAGAPHLVTPVPPRAIADGAPLAQLAAAIAAEPDGAIVVGAMPLAFAVARDAVFALAVRAGYPVLAESGSQLRFGPRDVAAVCVDHFDLVPAAALPAPKLVLQLGAEPVAAAWPAWLARVRPARWVLAGQAWRDPDGGAHAVVLGDPADAIARLLELLGRTPLGARDAGGWAEVEAAAARAAAGAIDQHARSETAIVRAAVEAMPEGALLQLGNSLPIRVVDHACAGGAARGVITQRGAAGIDGLIASAAGATRAGKPVLLVLGDVSFVHDLGGLVAARAASAAPLAILVVDNRGGQIFAGLPVAHADLGAAFSEHWLTPPGVDPSAVASALGVRAVTAASAAAAAGAVAAALAEPGVTVIHAPVAMSGAHDVRRTAIELYQASAPEQRTWRTS